MRGISCSCDRQLPAALALLELDGVADRILLCPPDVPASYFPELLARAGIDAIVTDGTGPAAQSVGDTDVIRLSEIPGPAPDLANGRYERPRVFQPDGGNIDP